MVNILSDSLLSLSDISRQNQARSRRSLARQKARNFERISRGRHGIAKPLNFNPPGLSNGARNNFRAVRSGAASFGNLLTELSFTRQEFDTDVAVQNSLAAFQARLDANRALASGDSDRAFNTVI